MTAFKAYDIRGRVGDELDAAFMFGVGAVFGAEVAQQAPVAVGFDARDSSPMLADALADGLISAGADVLWLGLCGTEEVYFATDHLGAGGGLMVTASHNPIGDNGLKLVGRNATPIGRESGLARIEAQWRSPPKSSARGRRRTVAPRDAYVARVLSFIEPQALAPHHLLVNAGNGAAGPTFDAIADALAAAGSPLRFERLFHEVDPRFPNGIPNPLLPQNHGPTTAAIQSSGADLGVAWDGDFDRCFFFDGQGRFVDGVYVVGLLAAAMLARHPGETVVYDPRAVLNTRAMVQAAGGRAVMARTGHSYMKAAMRAQRAFYGGEMSAHHYFRDFMFCDSGMIPWLLVVEAMSREEASLDALVADRIAAFPVSGELNFTCADPRAAIASVEAAYASNAHTRDDSDGLSLEFDGWRLNLRRSNTEALLRLNVEAAGDRARVDAEVAQISALIEAVSAPADHSETRPQESV